MLFSPWRCAPGARVELARRLIFDVRKSGNAELCARIGTGCRFGCALRVRGERTMQAAVEATMFGGKTLTAPLARHKNDGAAVEAAFRWLGWEIGE